VPSVLKFDTETMQSNQIVKSVLDGLNGEHHAMAELDLWVEQGL
jgi:hypothetical protein